MGKTFLIIDGKKDLDISRYGDCFVYKLSSCNVRSLSKNVFEYSIKKQGIFSFRKKNNLNQYFGIC